MYGDNVWGWLMMLMMYDDNDDIWWWWWCMMIMYDVVWWWCPMMLYNDDVWWNITSLSVEKIEAAYDYCQRVYRHGNKMECVDEWNKVVLSVYEVHVYI